jgi:hypothetical protein
VKVRSASGTLQGDFSDCKLCLQYENLGVAERDQVLSKQCLNLHNYLHGDVVKLVYTRALGARAVRREGSSPFIPTKLRAGYRAGF